MVERGGVTALAVGEEGLRGLCPVRVGEGHDGHLVFLEQAHDPEARIAPQARREDDGRLGERGRPDAESRSRLEMRDTASQSGSRRIAATSAEESSIMPRRWSRRGGDGGGRRAVHVRGR